MAKSERVDLAIEAVNRAGARALNAWILLLIASVFLAAKVAGTSHEQLFLARPFVLSLLGIEIPLVPFFAIGPFLFLTLHLSFLWLIRQLAGNARRLDAVLGEEASSAVVREAAHARIRVPVVGFLARQERTGPGYLMRLTVWATAIVAPLCLLLAFQIQFLPYHDPGVTWAQRTALIADLLLICALWPKNPSMVHRTRYTVRACLGTASAFVLGFSVFVATPPDWPNEYAVSGERWALALFATTDISEEDHRGGRCGGAPFSCLLDWKTWRTAVELERGGTAWQPTFALFGGLPDEITRRRTTPFSRNLILADVSLRPESTHEEIAEGGFRSIELRNRDLRRAYLRGAVLRHVDLIATGLDGADLKGVRIEEVRFGCSERPGRDRFKCSSLKHALLDGIQVHGANCHIERLPDPRLLQMPLEDRERLEKFWQDMDRRFRGIDIDRRLNALWGGDTLCIDCHKERVRGVPIVEVDTSFRLGCGPQFQGASLVGARFQDAKLPGTRFQAASLDGAKLESSVLTGSQFHGASLVGADLRGAWLEASQFQGAQLDRAQMQGSWLVQVVFQGASLTGTRLEGALLDRAELQGVSLQDTNLQGASLVGAYLQGADFAGANVTAADLRWASLWRARLVSVENSSAGRPVTATQSVDVRDLDLTESKGSEIAAWRVNIIKATSEGEGQLEALEQFDAGLEEWRGYSWVSRKAWRALANRAESPEFDDGLASDLLELACEGVAAPHVARGITWRFVGHRSADRNRPYAAAVSRGLLASDCEGAAGLTDKERKKLRDIACLGTGLPDYCRSEDWNVSRQPSG